MVNTQPYGGGLWHSWFDRDLGLAGRAVLKGANDAIETKLFDIQKPIARIPNLAIHLTSGTEREHFAPNLHEHAKALLSIHPDFIKNQPNVAEAAVSARIHPALLRLVASALEVDSGSIEDVEMQLIDLQPACLGGACDDFIYSGRLDNLCSAYQCLTALIQSSNYPAVATVTNVKMAMLFDHEEVGSASCQGAGSSLFMDTIQRIHSKLVQPSSTGKPTPRCLELWDNDHWVAKYYRRDIAESPSSQLHRVCRHGPCSAPQLLSQARCKHGSPAEQRLGHQAQCESTLCYELPVSFDLPQTSHQSNRGCAGAGVLCP
jgi:hypothetical protein